MHAESDHISSSESVVHSLRDYVLCSDQTEVSLGLKQEHTSAIAVRPSNAVNTRVRPQLLTDIALIFSKNSTLFRKQDLLSEVIRTARTL